MHPIKGRRLQNKNKFTTGQFSFHEIKPSLALSYRSGIRWHVGGVHSVSSHYVCRALYDYYGDDHMGVLLCTQQECGLANEQVDNVCYFGLFFLGCTWL